MDSLVQGPRKPVGAVNLLVEPAGHTSDFEAEREEWLETSARGEHNTVEILNQASKAPFHHSHKQNVSLNNLAVGNGASIHDITFATIFDEPT